MNEGAKDTPSDAMLRRVVAWWDPPADGPTNMALDEVLASEAARLDRVLVRISTWSEPTLSLGAFQAIADARSHRSLAGLPIVRRPSGGGAILHGSDVTLTVAVPRLHPCGGTPQRLYDAVHEGLVAEMSARGVPAALSPGADRGARGEQGVPELEPLLCFDRRATGDVVMPMADGRFHADAKILGSAQRRLRGAILQHGSLLLASNRSAAEDVRHPGLVELLHGVGNHGAWGWGQPDGIGLVRGWLARVAKSLGAGLEEPSGRFQPPLEGGVEHVVSRFRGDSWNSRR